jgi:SAM-dependent methyltransferase
MNKWKKIWKRKAEEQTKNLKKISGHENTLINAEDIVKNITQVLDIGSDDRVLEVGCAAGYLAQYFDCDYTGVDYIEEMCAKHVNLLNNKVICCEANRLPFRDNHFDKVVCFSVFHYFPDKEYAEEVIAEMIRVSNNMLFIGDLPEISHDANHLLFSKDEWPSWSIVPGYFRDSRFNVYKQL